MTLDSNSFTAKQYRWLYNIKDMPDNLCFYFWGLVLMVLLIIPARIFVLPFRIIKRKDKSAADLPFIVQFKVSVLFYFVVACLTAMVISLLFHFGYTNDNTLIVFIGDLFWIVTAIILAFCVIALISEGAHKMVLSFLWSKIEKYCPKINWK